jgi:hypothetical protein
MEKKLIYETELGYMTSLELRTILRKAFENAKAHYDNSMQNGSLTLASIYKSEMEAILNFQCTALEKEIERQNTKASEIKITDIPTDEING